MWRITYKDKYSGKKEVHINQNNQSDAEGWTRVLAENNNCKAVCEHVADGPYDYSGKVTHVISVGNDS
jgi:hypothetical protein